MAATSIVVADMIGIGVFTSLGFQVKDVTSGFTILMLWFVGGIVALCGAFCYAELGAMFPRSSGEYNFLTRAYHPVVGFLAGWLSATVGFAAPVALAAMAFGEYFKSIMPGLPPTALGIAIICIVSLIQLRGLQHGSTFQIASTVLKLVLIVVFVIAGFAIGNPQPISFAPKAIEVSLAAPLAISLVFVMYSYSGWNAATYIIEEIRDPKRNLPRALVAGTLVVIALYVALNAVFLYTTPIDKMVGQIDVALIAGTHIFGEWGGRLVGALICLGLISSVSAMMWIGPRVTMAMGQDIPLFKFLSQKSKKDVPAAAILLQVAVANLLLLTQSFEAVLDLIQFALTFCAFLTVLGLVRLRFTQPDLPRPYRAWGYPLTPAIFLSVSVFIMFYLVMNRPVQSLVGMAMMLAGVVIYYVAQYVQRPALSNVRIAK